MHEKHTDTQNTYKNKVVKLDLNHLLHLDLTLLHKVHSNLNATKRKNKCCKMYILDKRAFVHRQMKMKDFESLL